MTPIMTVTSSFLLGGRLTASDSENGLRLRQQNTTGDVHEIRPRQQAATGEVLELGLRQQAANGDSPETQRAADGATTTDYLPSASFIIHVLSLLGIC